MEEKNNLRKIMLGLKQSVAELEKNLELPAVQKCVGELKELFSTTCIQSFLKEGGMDQKDKMTIADWSSVFKNVILLIFVYLYFTGWLYAYYFFDHFGISLSAADIPFYYFLVYSYSVFNNFKSWIILFLISMTPVAWLYIGHFRKMMRTTILVILVISFFIIISIFFLICSNTAKKAATDEARIIRLGYAKKIVFVFKNVDNYKRYSDEFIEANKKGELRLITQKEDRYFVLHQRIAKEAEIPCGIAYDVAKSDILLTKTSLVNMP